MSFRSGISLLTTLLAALSCTPSGKFDSRLEPNPRPQSPGQAAGGAQPDQQAGVAVRPSPNESSSVRKIDLLKHLAQVEGTIGLLQSELQPLQRELRDSKAALEDSEAEKQALGAQLSELRTESSRSELSGLSDRRALIAETTSQELATSEAKLEWDVALAQLGTQVQQQRERVRALSAEEARQRSFNLDTDDWRRVRDELALESGRLQTLEAQLLNSQIQSRRQVALQTASREFTEQAGQVANQESVATDRLEAKDRQNELEEQIRQWNERSQNAGKRIADLQARADQITSEISRLQAEEGRLRADQG